MGVMKNGSVSRLPPPSKYEDILACSVAFGAPRYSTHITISYPISEDVSSPRSYVWPMLLRVSTYGSTEPYIPQDYNYIQMRLNIENISEEFAQELEEYRISGIQIRKAEIEDLSVFVKIYNRAFMRGSDPWSPVREEQFVDILGHKTTVVLIASILNEDVGFIITDLEEKGQVGIICGLGTDPRWQRRGIARYLGIASWDYFQNLKVKELRCEVYENNKPSYKLIDSLHFKEYGTKTYQF